MRVAVGKAILRELLTLLFWTAPITLLAIQFPPLVPYTPTEFSMGVSGFPFAFCDWGGGSSNANRIMLAPYLIDLALVGVAVQLAGVALRKLVWPPLALPLLILLNLFLWPLHYMGQTLMWGGNWGMGWWSIS